MQYTIIDIQPNEIVVRFDDDSIASVGIGSTTTASEIDALVGVFDADYYPPVNQIINPNIQVGDQRTSAPDLVGAVEESAILQPIPVSDIENEPYGNQFILYSALYYESLGITTIRDTITNYFIGKFGVPVVQEVLDEIQALADQQNAPDPASAELIEAGLDPDSIFSTAMEELESE